MRGFYIILIGILLLTSCASPSMDPLPPDTPVSDNPNSTNEPDLAPVEPYLPQVGDANLTRGEVYLDSTDILVLESYPVQINLLMKGNLPNPCYKLRVDVPAIDSDNRLNIEVYSVVDPTLICAQVLKEFERTIPLGSYPSGHYTLMINGEPAGEFDT